jgi:aminocarboxymuconate-semialdehyde decarboxylase
MIIDMHNHGVAPAAYERLLGEPFAYGARIEHRNDGRWLVFEDSMQQDPRSLDSQAWALLTDLEQSKSHLRDIGADGAVVSTYISLHRYTLDAEKALRLCRLLNDGLAAWIRDEPQFRGMAMLPLPDGAAAATELERSTTQLGLKGAMLVTNAGEGRNLDLPELEPLWEAAEALNAPLFLHPTNVAGSDRLGDYMLENLLGNPFDTTIAAASLILSGVLDRHQDLKVVLAHGGGYLSTAFARLNHGYEVNPATRRHAAQPPEAYLKRFYYDTILYHPYALMNLIELVGAGRIVLGTDYPFNMEPPEAVRAIEALEIARDQSEQILGNAAQLYGFEPALP